MPFTEEDKNEITNLVNTAINGVATNLRKTFEQARTKDATDLMTKLTATLDEKLAKLTPAEPEDPEGGGKPGKGGKNAQTDREMATLRQEMKRLQDQNQEIANARAAERAENRSAKLERAVAAELEPLGITGSRFRGAYARLIMDGLVKYASDDSSDIVFVDTAAGAEVDYRPGLAGWAKTEDAKLYIPSSGSQGSGSRPRPAVPPKTGPMTRQERDQKMNSILGEWAENPR